MPIYLPARIFKVCRIKLWTNIYCPGWACLFSERISTIRSAFLPSQRHSSRLASFRYCPVSGNNLTNSNLCRRLCLFLIYTVPSHFVRANTNYANFKQWSLTSYESLKQSESPPKIRQESCSCSKTEQIVNRHIHCPLSVPCQPRRCLGLCEVLGSAFSHKMRQHCSCSCGLFFHVWSSTIQFSTLPDNGVGREPNHCGGLVCLYVTATTKRFALLLQVPDVPGSSLGPHTIYKNIGLREVSQSFYKIPRRVGWRSSKQITTPPVHMGLPFT